MKRRDRQRKAKVMFLKQRQLVESAQRNRGMVDLDQGNGVLKLFTQDGKPLDFASQPRASTCGICSSSKITNYATIVAGMDPDDDETVFAIVLGICGPCEALGPDVFLPEMARRLREEAERA